MRPSISLTSSPSRFQSQILVGLGALLALAAGLAVAPSFEALLFVAVITGAAVWFWAWIRPKSALWLLMASSIFLLAIPVSEHNTVNPIDFLFVPVLLGAWFWHHKRSRTATGSRVDRAEAWLIKAGLLFYGVAVLSLVRLAASGNPEGAWNSLLHLGRSFQGALLYPLVIRLLRDPGDLRKARNAICIGIILSLIVNAVWFAFFELQRAGAVWILGTTAGAIGDPNEAGSSILLVWVAALAIPLRRWQAIMILALSVVLLLATTSRSGLLAWTVFCIAYGMRARVGWVWAAPVAIVALWPVLPAEWTGRLLRTVTLTPGSSEAYSSLVRMFSWRAAWDVFLQHPLLGVGYVSFHFVSSEYNQLRLVLGTAESFYLEVASGMGVVGLISVALIFLALRRMGAVARSVSPPGSWGDRLGRMTLPFLLGTAVANLTGDNLVGLLGVAQMALFAGFLTQAARLGEAETAALRRGA